MTRYPTHLVSSEPTLKRNALIATGPGGVEAKSGYCLGLSSEDLDLVHRYSHIHRGSIVLVVEKLPCRSGYSPDGEDQKCDITDPPERNLLFFERFPA